MAENYLKLNGIDFIEFASNEPQKLENLFLEFGFSKVMKHKDRNIDLFKQNDIVFLVNYEPKTFASGFVNVHGPSVCSMGWRVEDADFALKTAIERGANPSKSGDYRYLDNREVPAIFGIGESLIYFMDHHDDPNRFERMGFVSHPNPILKEDNGFLVVDHLTNNVYKGTMSKWADFYKSIFGFVEVRYFDIKGVKTGLTSFALQSPCKKFCIPINEADEKKSQINEYLDEYNGPGVQHIAFLTSDIVKSLHSLEKTNIETLDILPNYYEEVFNRVPNVTEDREELKRLNILVDGDDEGYLLQIFTKNVVGPIFIEIIQRKNHYSFGEGNFQALFDSIERDQARRGVFDNE